jgi:hypothetical protein
MITRLPTEPAPDASALRAVEKRIFRHGFDGHVRTDIGDLPDAVAKAMLTGGLSLVIVDDPAFDVSPGDVPVLAVKGVVADERSVRLIAAVDGTNGVAAEVARRLARGDAKAFRVRRRARA